MAEAVRPPDFLAFGRAAIDLHREQIAGNYARVAAMWRAHY